MMATDDVREFLVIYDYGTGGLWGFASAPSEAEVLDSFPELRIVTEKPSWMTPDEQAKVKSDNSFVVGKPATYPAWLQVIIAKR